MSETSSPNPGKIQEESQTFVTHPDESESLSVSIVMAVSEVLDKDAKKMSQLSDSLDPNALEELFSGMRDNPDISGPTVEFEYEGCQIRVSPRTIEITRPARLD